MGVVAERVAEVIEDQIRYEVNLLRGVENEVLDLSGKLGTIRSVLKDAEKRGVKEQSVKRWLKKLEDTAYQMEDILDEWHYTRVNQRTKQKEKVYCSFIPSSSSCLCFKKLGVRHTIGIKIQDVKVALDNISNEKDQFKFVTSLPPSDVEPEPRRVQSTSSIELAKVHGLDIHNNMNEIVTKLTVVNGGSELLSIVGMGGLGKTTLAQLVYNDSRVKDSFELRIWICVSDPFDVDGIARGIVNSVGKVTIPQGTDQLELVLEKLRDSISGKKFILVLDDVWTEKYEEWEPLKINLGHGAASSKILITSRNVRVAKMMGSSDNQIYYPQHLSDEECWSLLRHISLSGRSEDESREFEDVGKKIAGKCKGLPLAANVLGSLLQFKNNLEEWENVLESEIWELEEAEVDLFPHLLLSYNELSPTLKRCFSYCAVYPKDSYINVEILIEEWMAQGYLGSIRGNGGVEVKGRDYFNSLAMRSLFQDVERSDGSIVGCKMHDIVHDFALFLRGDNNNRLQEGVAAAAAAATTKRGCQFCRPLLVSRVHEYRSLVWDWDSPTHVCDCIKSVRVLRIKWNGRCGLPQGMQKLIHLRWLELSHNELSEEVVKIICRLYFLQKLLLSYCFFQKIPIEIGNLVELRHLDLSQNIYLTELPESMCNLVELRILNLNLCTHLAGLPEGIHRLQNLQRLSIKGTPASRRLPRGFGELSGLRTLGTKFYGGSGWNKLGLLKKLNGLSGSLKLEIKITTSSSDVEELVKDAQEAELRSKIHIHTLRIQFNCKEDEVDGSSSSSLWMEVMEALEPNQQKLYKLVIGRYMGSRLPEWISSPLSLVKDITLYDCNELSSLPALGKLPCLELLSMSNMYGLKFVGRELLGIEIESSPSPSTKEEEVVAFPKLKELSVEYFREWSEWEDITAEEEECGAVSIMPCLEMLIIKRCGSLKKLPHRLLRKASSSSSLRILNIHGSTMLQSQYEDKDGSEWRSISQFNPQLQLHLKLI